MVEAKNLYVGRLAPVKKVGRLIRAMEKLPESVALIIVGGGQKGNLCRQSAGRRAGGLLRGVRRLGDS